MTIIEATIADAKTLFDWRNDPLTRAMSRNPDPVEWSGHMKWLLARLERSKPHLYIARTAHPVGTFRVDGDEISYTVAPNERGKGVGLTMLCCAREMFGPLRAEIYERNIASIRIAERAGMIVKMLTD